MHVLCWVRDRGPAAKLTAKCCPPIPTVMNFLCHGAACHSTTTEEGHRVLPEPCQVCVSRHPALEQSPALISVFWEAQGLLLGFAVCMQTLWRTPGTVLCHSQAKGSSPGSFTAP